MFYLSFYFSLFLLLSIPSFLPILLHAISMRDSVAIFPDQHFLLRLAIILLYIATNRMIRASRDFILRNNPQVAFTAGGCTEAYLVDSFKNIKSVVKSQFLAFLNVFQLEDSYANFVQFCVSQFGSQEWLINIASCLQSSGR